MTLQMNQLAISTVQGQLDLELFTNVITAAVDVNLATPLVAGQPVKMVNIKSGIPTVTALTANTDATFGFVARNIKDINFPALSRVEIALAGSYMYMTAGAAIAAGAKIEVVYTTNKVITNAGTNPVAGYALDKATADGDLIRVGILSPYTSPFTIADISGLQSALDTLTAGVLTDVKSVQVTATIAEINAGKVLVPASTGKSIVVLNVTQRVTGNFATTTSVDLQSTTTHTKALVSAVAALTTGAVLFPTSSNVTPGAGFGTALEVSESLSVVNTGSAATGGTSIKFTVTYAYV